MSDGLFLSRRSTLPVCDRRGQRGKLKNSLGDAGFAIAKQLDGIETLGRVPVETGNQLFYSFNRGAKTLRLVKFTSLRQSSCASLKAWRLLPDRKSVLLDLGRDWKALNRIDQANAALLAASRGGEPRAAEAARELLPARYPYVYEFRRALDLDTANVELPRAGLSVPSHEPQRGGRA